MEYTFLSALILLFMIMDPFGNFPLFATILKKYNQKERIKIIIREHVIAFMILLIFMLIGDQFLKIMGLSKNSLEIAGGVILFLIAIKMVFGGVQIGEEIEHKPLIVPLAIPAIAGPSALATVMLFVNSKPTMVFSWIAVIAVAICLSAFVLIILDKIKNFLGNSFLVAMEKLMGLILVALSIEMLIRGIKGFFV